MRAQWATGAKMSCRLVEISAGALEFWTLYLMYCAQGTGTPRRYKIHGAWRESETFARAQGSGRGSLQRWPGWPRQEVVGRIGGPACEASKLKTSHLGNLPVCRRVHLSLRCPQEEEKTTPRPPPPYTRSRPDGCPHLHTYTPTRPTRNYPPTLSPPAFLLAVGGCAGALYIHFFFFFFPFSPVKGRRRPLSLPPYSTAFVGQSPDRPPPTSNQTTSGRRCRTHSI